MVNGSVCRYRLIFPFEAKDYDEIKVQIGSITNAIAYLIETPEFKSKEANQTILKEEDDFATASSPNEVYLTVVADASDRPAEYEIKLSFRHLTDAEVRE